MDRTCSRSRRPKRMKTSHARRSYSRSCRPTRTTRRGATSSGPFSQRMECAEAIAREWSMEAEDQYDEAAFDALVRSFDPNRGITLGTLHHHAEQNGWTKPRGHSPTDCMSPTDADTRKIRARLSPLLTAEEVKALPNLPYRVRGLLPAQGVAAIYGDPGLRQIVLGSRPVLLDRGWSLRMVRHEDQTRPVDLRRAGGTWRLSEATKGVGDPPQPDCSRARPDFSLAISRCSKRST